MSGAWYERVAVSLGWLAPHEVGDGTDLPPESLVRRFSSEASRLKEPKRSFGLLGGCSAPQIADAEGQGSPNAGDIEIVLQCWLKRLDSEKTGVTLGALLESRAIDMVLQTMITCKSSVVINLVTNTTGDADAPRPLAVLLTRVSAVPAPLMTRLLNLIAESMEVMDVSRDSGMSNEESEITEQGRQWVLDLIRAASLDVHEMALRHSASPVEHVEATFPLLGGSKPSSPEQVLDVAEQLTKVYQELKECCDQLGKTKPNTWVGDPRPEKTFQALVVALSKHRQSLEPRVHTMRSTRARKFFNDSVAASHEVEALLVGRAEKCKLLSGALPKLHQHHRGIAALCLEAEGLRGNHLAAVHKELQRVLWGPKADGLWQDGSSLPVVRTVVKRAAFLSEQAWREMVHMVVESLDDKNTLFARSEEMTNRRNAYKELMAEMRKHSERLGKMEQAASSASITAPDSQTRSIPWERITVARCQVPSSSAEEIADANTRTSSLRELQVMLCAAAGMPPPPTSAGSDGGVGQNKPAEVPKAPPAEPTPQGQQKPVAKSSATAVGSTPMRDATKAGAPVPAAGAPPAKIAAPPVVTSSAAAPPAAPPPAAPPPKVNAVAPPVAASAPAPEATKAAKAVAAPVPTPSAPTTRSEAPAVAVKLSDTERHAAIARLLADASTVAASSNAGVASHLKAASVSIEKALKAEPAHLKAAAASIDTARQAAERKPGKLGLQLIANKLQLSYEAAERKPGKLGLQLIANKLQLSYEAEPAQLTEAERQTAIAQFILDAAASISNFGVASNLKAAAASIEIAFKVTKDILVAACDLDKTLYPPAGPRQSAQLQANVDGMFRFEDAGGFVFPVTGNNLLLAQRKFNSPTDPKKKLRDLCVHPGIYTNGGLVMGPGGNQLEKHALGNLVLSNHADRPDFVSAILDFCHDENVKASLLENVGLCVLTPDCLGGCDTAYSNVDGFAELQMVTATKMTKDELIAARGDVLQIMFLFPPIRAQDAQAEREVYESTTKLQQEKIIAAMRERGLMDCAYADGAVDGVGAGIKVIAMKDPWPEIDINVAGVDKGKALSRFLHHRSVLDLLRVDVIDIPKQVAVFGDAANDVPMFQAIGSLQAGLRVVMPHSDDKILDGLATVRAEVSEVLNLICEAKCRGRSEENEKQACGTSHGFTASCAVELPPQHKIAALAEALVDVKRGASSDVFDKALSGLVTGSEAQRMADIVHGFSSAAAAAASTNPGIASSLMKAAGALASVIPTRMPSDEEPGSAAVNIDPLVATAGSKSLSS